MTRRLYFDDQMTLLNDHTTLLDDHTILLDDHTTLPHEQTTLHDDHATLLNDHRLYLTTTRLYLMTTRLYMTTRWLYLMPTRLYLMTNRKQPRVYASSNRPFPSFINVKRVLFLLHYNSLLSKSFIYQSTSERNGNTVQESDVHPGSKKKSRQLNHILQKYSTHCFPNWKQNTHVLPLQGVIHTSYSS